MKSATKAEISDTIKNGEVLLIAYHGGSKPGAKREIIPIKIIDETKFRARCYASNSVKPFMFAKTEILSRDHEGHVADWNNTKPASEKRPPRDGHSIAIEKQNHWKNMGWHISFTDLQDDGSFGFHLHRRKKRGTGYMKHPTHSLEYVPINYLYGLSDSGEEICIENGPSAKPWRCCSRAFSNYGRALEFFIATVNSETP